MFLVLIIVFQDFGYNPGGMFFKRFFAVNRPVLYADGGTVEGLSAGPFLRRSGSVVM